MLMYVVQVSTEHYVAGDAIKSSQTVPMLETVSNMCVCTCVKHLPDWCTAYDNSTVSLSSPYSHHSPLRL